MNQTPRLSNILCSGIVIAVSLFGQANRPPQALAVNESETLQVSPSALWRDRGDIRSLDLLHGAGGLEHSPMGTFTFVKEDKDGTQPKFEIVDEQGVHWKAKVGEEAKSETAATRLVWAAGYFTDEDYYLPELRVKDMPKPSRGAEFYSAGGILRGVRMERDVAGRKKIGNWSWSDNPFEGTKEMNGLRIMMALLNNWDVKTLNNAVYRVGEESPYYVVNDLGATFGKTGGVGFRTKSNLGDYAASKFIAQTQPEGVDLTLKSRPIFLLAVDPFHYFKLAGRAKIAQDIPYADVKWIGQLLGQLSDEQVRDCFRGAGFSPTEVEGFAKVVLARITDLNRF